MRSFDRLARIAALCMFVAVTCAAHASAAEDPQTAKAKRLFQAGQKAYQRDHFEEALEFYQSAYEAKALPQFLFNIGQCHRKLKDHAKAIAAYRQFLHDLPDAPNREEVEQFIAQEEKAESPSAPTPLLPPPPVNIAEPAPQPKTVPKQRAPLSLEAPPPPRAKPTPPVAIEAKPELPAPRPDDNRADNPEPIRAPLPLPIHRLFLNVMAGTGIGLARQGNAYEIAYVYSKADSTGRYIPLTVSSSGVAAAPVHGAFEVGVQVTRALSLSALVRLEGTIYNNADSSDDASMKAFGGGTTKATTALAGIFNVRYDLSPESRHHSILHAGFGAGQIRYVLEITGANSDTNPLVDYATANYYEQKGKDPFTGLKAFQPPTVNYVCLDKNPCFDNVTIGYLLASIGFNYYFELFRWRGGNFGINADVTTLFAFGDQFGVNFDLQLGVGTHFF